MLVLRSFTPGLSLSLTKTVFTFLLAVVASCGAASVAAAQSASGSIKTDLGVYLEPPAPPLPAAGGTLTDPLFGTNIMRVTDATDGGNAGTDYSYWPTFNQTNTHLLVSFADGSARVYDFDPVNFRLGAKADLPTPPITNAGWLPTSYEDAIWSGTTPDTLYVHRGVAVFAYDVARHTYSSVFDLSDRFPAGSYIFQMSRSLNDDVFAFTLRDANYQVAGYVAYRRSTNSLLINQRVTSIDEVQVDKSGRYLVVKTGAQGRGAIEVRIFDLQSGAVTDLTDDAPDYAPGHSDNGNGMVVGYDNWLNRITFRSLSTPHALNTVLDLGNQWGNDFHVSMLGDDEAWALVSFFGTAAPGLLQRELVLVATDGSGQVRRLAHHYSVFRDYADTPRANLSRDGRFAAFTSNWGGSARRDLFILRMPPVAPSPPAYVTRPRRVTNAARPNVR